MTTLTDRYIATTVRELPRERRTEISNELRESIADQIEARVSSGEGHNAAEYEVLNQMGDPIRLAASYAGRRLTLIGPTLYPAWRRFLVMVLSILVPLLAILSGAGAIMDGQSFGSVLGSVIGTAAMTAVQVAFWVTLVFAILERKVGQDDAHDRDFEWSSSSSPNDLPSNHRPLLNPAFTAEFSWLSDHTALASTLICAVFALIWGTDIIERTTRHTAHKPSDT